MMRLIALLTVCLVGGGAGVYMWKVQGFFEPRVNMTAPESTIGEPPPIVKQLPPHELAQQHPVDFLATCVTHYKETIANLGASSATQNSSGGSTMKPAKGYTCTFIMHERVNGKLKPAEEIECWFREEPYSVLMHWKKGAGLADASLFVRGENDNMMCVRPSSPFGKALGWVKRSPESQEAKDSARYAITDFGLRCGTERTWRAWKALEEKNVQLQIDFEQRSVPELDGRVCYVVHRHCPTPEEEGLTDVTLFIDPATWFQVGSVLRANDTLIGEYWFKDIEFKTEFDEKQFKPEILKKY